MIIAEIGREAAIPFIKAYCAKWKLPICTDGAALATWFGAFHRHHLRGVLGLTGIKEFTNSMFVHGLYVEDSKFGKLAVSGMIALLDTMPQTLYCSVYLPNVSMLKVITKRGWRVEAVDLIRNGAFLVKEAK